MQRKISVFSLILATALLAGACAPVKATRGNFLDDERLRTLQVGVSTKAEVQQTLGTPTTTDPFDPNIWFYVGEKTSTTAFFKPEVEARKVIVMKFNEEGFLQEASAYSEKDGKRIETVDKKTPAPGKEMNAFEQFLSNMGKFNQSGFQDNRAGQGQ